MTTQPRRHKEGWEQIANWCHHFNGIMERVCKAGVAYDSVRMNRENTQPGQSGYMWPCLKEDGLHNCALQSFPTEEEARAQDAESQEYSRRYLADISAGICPQCKDSGPFEQIGPCVYCAKGHRLYQGKLPKSKK